MCACVCRNRKGGEDVDGYEDTWDERWEDTTLSSIHTSEHHQHSMQVGPVVQVCQMPTSQCAALCNKPMKYRIAGNIRGTKFSWISLFA